jgi:CheY-like chemotaxis protein
MARILILEDDPNRMEIFRDAFKDRHEIVHVDNARVCIDFLKNDNPDVLFLDHDLGGQTYVAESDANTGSEVVRFLTSNACRWAGPIVVHSCNTIAAQAMEHDLRMAGYNKTHRIPFTTLVQYLYDPGFIV